MKFSLIALTACCAVTSSAFALTDLVGVNPLTDVPGTNPPRLVLTDVPGTNPPRYV